MAFANRSFHREVSRRFLIEVVKKLEEASNAESTGDFAGQAKCDEEAVAGMLSAVDNYNSALLVCSGEMELKPESERSFWEEVLPPVYKRMKEEEANGQSTP